MKNLVFVKLGGSLITDKRQRYHARQPTIQRLATEMACALKTDPSLRLVIGHGSGSFGHVAAKESGYDRQLGHPSLLAMAQVGQAARALNQIVLSALVEAGVPALSFPPSASAYLKEGRLVDMTLDVLRRYLLQGGVPLVFGDVALYEGQAGGAITSTEMIFRLLAEHLQPQRILLLGVVDGVFAQVPVMGEPSPPLIAQITSQNWERVRLGLGGSHGTDVTGGMIAKVAEALALVERYPALEVRIMTGEVPDLLEKALLEPTFEVGTLVHT